MPVVLNACIETCSSTQSYLIEAATEAGVLPHGTWIAARDQTSGRGRHGGVWHSASGNLSFSMIVEPSRSGGLLTRLSLMAACAAVRALETNWPALKGERNRIEIKWPNDLIWNDRKLGGILCESLSSRSQIVVGIGANLRRAPQIPGGALAADLSEYVVDDEDVSAFCPVLAEALKEQLRDVSDDRWAQAVAEYSSRAWLPAQTPVVWGKNREHRGSVLGLGPAGELRVRCVDSNQAEMSLYSEIIEKLRPAGPTASDGSLGG